MRPKLLLVSSLRALLLHKGLGAEIAVSPEARVGEGYVARPMERGDLQSGYPTIKSTRAVAAK
jgi:hypothetical protein